jgi:hypothetical protein
MNDPLGKVTRSELIWVSMIAVALAAYFTWPMAVRPASLGRVEMGDGQFSIWNVAWVAHALTTPGVELFDANIFHPHRGTLAYSESNLGAGALAVPAYLVTGNPYAAHNSAVLIALSMSVVGMYLLARRLTGSREAALLAAIVFTFCPYLFARTAHIQLMMTAPLPFALLAFHRFVERTTALRAIVLGLAIAAQALFCAYYGVLAGLLVGLGVLVFAGARGVGQQARWWSLSLLAALVAGLVVLPAFVPYLQLQSGTGFGRSLDESRRYSADWRAYLASSAWAHRWMLPYLKHWNEVLFPGFTALIVGAFGLFVAFRPRAAADARLRLARVTAVFYLLILVLAAWSSFGPVAGLYSALYHTVPVFSLLRAPARFGIAVTLALAVFTAVGSAVVLERMPVGRRRWLTAAVAILVVMELTTTIPYKPARDVPEPYRVLAAAERGAVAEFPFYHRPGDRFRHSLYMLGSTWHWQPLLNGYSDFVPEEVPAVLESFPNDEGLAWLGARGARYVVFHLGLYDPARRRLLLQRIEAASYLRPRHVQGTVLLYEIVARSGEQP